LKPKEIELQYIESKKQKAGFLTKSLGMAEFENIDDSLAVGNHAFEKECQNVKQNKVLE
jgi:hypothetical protein